MFCSESIGTLSIFSSDNLLKNDKKENDNNIEIFMELNIELKEFNDNGVYITLQYTYILLILYFNYVLRFQNIYKIFINIYKNWFPTLNFWNKLESHKLLQYKLFHQDNFRSI